MSFASLMHDEHLDSCRMLQILGPLMPLDYMIISVNAGISEVGTLVGDVDIIFDVSCVQCDVVSEHVLPLFSVCEGIVVSWGVVTIGGGGLERSPGCRTSVWCSASNRRKKYCTCSVVTLCCSFGVGLKQVKSPF